MPVLSIVLVVLFPVTIVVATGIGAVGIPRDQVWEVVSTRLLGGSPDVAPEVEQIVWTIRLPRVLLAAVVGAGLALAGLCLQAVVRNPLADPYILGAASGASAAAVAVIVLGSSAVLGLGLSAAAFLGALVSLLLTLALGQRAGQVNSTRQVGAACDLVNYQHRLDPTPTPNGTQAFSIDLMFRQSLGHIAPSLEARTWSLEASKEPSLITSDRPVTLWSPVRSEYQYQGVGIADAEEIWFPVDPSRMLVLRRGGPERVRRIGPDRLIRVNEHIARHCTDQVVAHPSAAGLIAGLPLARRRPTVRFWRGPAVDESGEDLGTEILHVWRPLRDIPDCPDLQTS
ncbi:MAG: iron chelate uptake ABC transporter family permease subunit [Actinomycetota bacterium]